MFDHQLTIRRSGPDDVRTLCRLVDLDSRPHLRARALVAEVDGEAVAAVGLDGGAVVAHPFRPTADVVRLLEAQRRALQATAPAAEGPWTSVLRALRFTRPMHGAA